jgi:hypothetical protein
MFWKVEENAIKIFHNIYHKWECNREWS